MPQYKRILAAIVMVISVLVLLVSLTGIIGTWVVQSKLTAGLEMIAGGAETGLRVLFDGLDRIDETLSGVNDQVAGVEQDLQDFGSDVEKNKPLASAVSDRLETRLGPLVESTKEIMMTVNGAVTYVNSTIDAINTIPFVSVPSPELERVTHLSEDMEDLRTQVDDLKTDMDQRRSEIIQGSVEILTTPTSQITSMINEKQDRVSGVNENLTAVQEGLANFKSTIVTWLTWLAVIATLVLLWIALSQAGLFLIGWRFYSGHDLLVQYEGDTPIVQDGSDLDSEEANTNESV